MWFSFLKKPDLSERNPHYLRALMKGCLHPWVRVDQAGRPLPPKIVSILVGLALKLVSLCSIISIAEKDLDVLLYFGVFMLVA